MKLDLLPVALIILFVLAASRAGQAQTAPPASQPQAPALTAPQGKVAPPSGKIDITQEPIVKIVANVQPAVVNITAQETVPEYDNNPYFQLYRGGRSRM